MSDLVVNVRLWDKPVGALSWDASREIAYFEYEPAFVRNPLPVSPIKMPVAKGVFSFAERLRNEIVYKMMYIYPATAPMPNNPARNG